MNNFEEIISFYINEFCVKKNMEKKATIYSISDFLNFCNIKYELDNYLGCYTFKIESHKCAIEVKFDAQEICIGYRFYDYSFCNNEDDSI